MLATVKHKTRERIFVGTLLSFFGLALILAFVGAPIYTFGAGAFTVAVVAFFEWSKGGE